MLLIIHGLKELKHFQALREKNACFKRRHLTVSMGFVKNKETNDLIKALTKRKDNQHTRKLIFCHCSRK